MRVLSIEIGTDVTHVAEVDYKVRNPRIYQSFSFRTPAGMVGEAAVSRNEEFRAALKALLDEHNVKTRKAVFVVNSGKIASREVEIPDVKENKIRDLLNANSSEYFPVDLSQYQLVYRTVEGGPREKKSREKDKDKDKEKTRKVFVFAVPSELVSSYEDLAVFLSLELTALDYVGNSVLQLMRRMSGINTGCTVKIDDESTMITIIRYGEVVLQRTIFYGVGEVYSLVEESGLFADRKDVSTQTLMEQERFMHHDLNREPKENETPLDRLKDEVTESLRPMIGNISRVLDYYLSRGGGAEIRECILVGNGARMRGLDMLMSRELNVPVYAMTPQRLGAMGVNYNMVMTEFFACYGAVLAPLDFTFGEQRTAQLLQEKKKRELLVFQLFAAACVLCGVLLLCLEGVGYMSRQGELNRLEREKNSLSYIENIYNEYVNTKVRYYDVTKMDSQTMAASDVFADALQEMEQKLPSSIQVKSVTTDGLGISMEVAVGSKEEAAQTLAALSTFESFRAVETSSITEVTDEAGNVSVEFSVMCTYVNGGDTAEETVETTPEEDVNTYLQGDPYIYPDFNGNTAVNTTETGDAENE